MTRCRFCERPVTPKPDLDPDLCSAECRDREERGRLLPHEHNLAEYLAGQKLAPDALIAGELHLSPVAWGKLRRSDPELRDALARGRAREHQRLVEALYVEAVEGGSVPAAQFLLRCRHGYTDKSDDAPKVNVSIALPAALTVEQFAKLRGVVAGPRAPELVDVTPKALPEGDE